MRHSYAKIELISYRNQALLKDSWRLHFNEKTLLVFCILHEFMYENYGLVVENMRRLHILKFHRKQAIAHYSSQILWPFIFEEDLKKNKFDTTTMAAWRLLCLIEQCAHILLASPICCHSKNAWVTPSSDIWMSGWFSFKIFNPFVFPPLSPCFCITAIQCMDIVKGIHTRLNG